MQVDTVCAFVWHHFRDHFCPYYVLFHKRFPIFNFGGVFQLLFFSFLCGSICTFTFLPHHQSGHKCLSPAACSKWDSLWDISTAPWRQQVLLLLCVKRCLFHMLSHVNTHTWRGMLIIERLPSISKSELLFSNFKTRKSTKCGEAYCPYIPKLHIYIFFLNSTLLP